MTTPRAFALLALAALVTACSKPSGGQEPASAKPGGPQAAAPAKAAAPAAPAKVEDPKAVYRVPLEDSPARGDRDALVTIVVSSDFECPFCKQGAAVLKRVGEAYRGKVRVVWKNNPLAMHPNAIPAALLAEEARAQGGDAKFWAAHDALFDSAPALDRAALGKVAAKTGLKKASVEKALDEKAHMARIWRDQQLVASLGARGTPIFFVNGRKVIGAVPYEAMKAVVEEELAKAEALVKSGVARRDVYAKIAEKGATAPVMIDAPAPAASPNATAAKVPLRQDDPVRGPAMAKVTVALFSDFQCPFCGKVEPALKQLLEAYPKDVRLVWKHLPLSFHPNAAPAAKAAEAARAQGKFWEMHDRLFASQSLLSDALYAQAAKDVGLDVARFERDRADEKLARRLQEDQQAAASAGATGTPTMFVNCRKLVGAKGLPELKAIVDEEIAKADAMLSKGATFDAGFYDRICAANVASAPPPAPAAAAAPKTGVKVAIRPDDPAKGRADAPVTVVEFSDFQCPFCSRAEPAVQEIEKSYGKDVRVVWKHLPLSFHQNAMPAALAAEAARAQGKFWPMHDRLFANQQSLTAAAFEQYARELGLDLARFRAAVAAPETRKRVEEDVALAGAVAVGGTPTFVVNGDVVVGSNGLRAAVERHLAAR